MRRGLLIVFVATAAYADNKHDAAQLFEQGRALAGKAQFEDACEKFAKSNDLDRAGGTEVNLGDCHEHLGHLAMAWRWFSDAAALWEAAGDNRIDYAKKRAALLAPRLATIVVRLHDPAGATVTIGGRDVKARKKIKELVDQGAVEIKVELPGGPPYQQTFEVAAGATKTVWPQGGDAEPDPEPEPEPGPGPEAGPHHGGWRAAFAGAATVTVAGLGIYLYGRHEIDDAKDQLCHGGAYLTMRNCQFPVTLTQQKVDQLNAQGDRGRTYTIAGELTTVLAAAFAVVAGYEGFFAGGSVTVTPTAGGAAVSVAW